MTVGYNQSLEVANEAITKRELPHGENSLKNTNDIK